MKLPSRDLRREDSMVQIAVLARILIIPCLVAMLLPATVMAQTWNEAVIGITAWGRPISPETRIDADELTVGENVSDLLVILVVKKSNGNLSPADFDELVAGIAGESSEDDDAKEVMLPSYLDGSVASWDQRGEVGLYSITSLRHGTAYVFWLFTTSSEREAKDLLNDIAHEVLVSGPAYQSSRLIDLFSDNFTQDAAATTQRPLDILPGRDEIPADFEFLDKDYLVYSEN